MSVRPPTPRVLLHRTVLLFGLCMLLPSGALAATPLHQEQGPQDIRIPGTEELKEEARVHRRKRRKRAVKRARILAGSIHIEGPRVRVRAQRRRKVVVHHSPAPTVVVRSAAPRTRVIKRRHSRPVVVHQETRRAPKAGSPNNWLYAGGGFGSVAGLMGDGESESAGRGVFGAGGQKSLFYGGGELAITSSETEMIDLTAAGFAGLTIPNSAIQPMIGVRAGAGHHTTLDDELSPHLVVGPQLGFMARRPGTRHGVRVMADVGFDYGIAEQRISPEFFLTLSAVF